MASYQSGKLIIKLHFAVAEHKHAAVILRTFHGCTQEESEALFLKFCVNNERLEGDIEGQWTVNPVNFSAASLKLRR